MVLRLLPSRLRSWSMFTRFVVGTIRLAGTRQGPLPRSTGRAVCLLILPYLCFPGVSWSFFGFFGRVQCPPKSQAFPRAQSVSLLCPWDIFILHAKKALLVYTACYCTENNILRAQAKCAFAEVTKTTFRCERKFLEKPRFKLKRVVLVVRVPICITIYTSPHES